MLNQADLDAALSNHDNEMNLCEQRRCDWALLHLVLAYPDICSGLQVPNPDENVGERYRSWCNQFLKTPHLTGAEWWAMRNAVLHQGSAIIKSGTRYSRFEFAVASPPDHARVEGDVLHLDVVKLATEMKGGVSAWKAWLLRAPSPAGAAIVEQSLARVVAVYLPAATALVPATSLPTPSLSGNAYVPGTASPVLTPMKSK